MKGMHVALPCMPFMSFACNSCAPRCSSVQWLEKLHLM